MIENRLMKQQWLALWRGVGQVMLQRNAVTGALFVLAIAVNSWLMALAALLGSALGLLQARLCRFPAQEIDDGLYGFNGALVAIAALLFWSVTPQGIAVALIGTLLATCLMRVMQHYRLLPFTFPFIAVVWLALWLVPGQQLLTTHEFAWRLPLLDGALQGVGQVMFQGNSLTGLIFLLALAVSGCKSAVQAAVASVAGVALALLLAWPEAQLSMGLFGYNAVLVAIAVPLVSKRWGLLLLGVILSILFTRCLLLLQLPALTFPFVLATWLMALLDKRLVKPVPVEL